MGQDILNIGYLALPETPNGMGVIVIQEWWGLVPHIKDVAERFAAAGYVTLAPDIYNGTTTKSPDEAQRLFMALNIEKAAEELDSAIDCVLKHPAVKVKKLGVVGFCMGGQLALLAATTSEHVGAVVDFYGVHPNVSPDFSKLTAPVLGIFGENDDFVPPEAVQQLETAIQQAGGSIEAHSYANAGHAFFNDSRPEAYNATDATDAWQRVLTFLPQALAT